MRFCAEPDGSDGRRREKLAAMACWKGRLPRSLPYLADPPAEITGKTRARVPREIGWLYSSGT